MTGSQALEAAADKLEIHELLARYGRGADTRNWELWRDVFTPNASIDFSTVTGVIGDPIAVSESLASILGNAHMTAHYFTNVEVELSGDEAVVHALFFSVTQFTSDATPMLGGGTHQHHVVRGPEGWRSRQLVVASTWMAS